MKKKEPVKRPEKWAKRICMQCGKEFETRIIYIKRGGGKFCDKYCSAKYINSRRGPSSEETKRKISQNHADVSGKNNPMYGKKGKDAPAYIDGRSIYIGETYKKIAFANLKHECSICGSKIKKDLEVHHKDGNHDKNVLSNLVILCKSCHRKFHVYERDSKGRFISSKLNKEIEI